MLGLKDYHDAFTCGAMVDDSHDNLHRCVVVPSLLLSFGGLVAGRASACGRLGAMRGGSAVGQTVQPAQAWQNGR